MNRTVMKFGGGCLPDGEGVLRVVGIVKARAEARLVVVSAVKGVTDALARALEDAVRREAGVPAALRDLRERHEAIAARAVPDEVERARLSESLAERFAKLEKLLLGVAYVGEAGGFVRASALSFGERWAALMLTAALRAAGVPAEAWEADEAALETTDESPDHATADLARWAERLGPPLERAARDGVVPVLTGFFGRTPSGRTALFGRNASDYSAAAAARAAGAGRLEIWKDVEGFMSADPGAVPGAIRLDALSRAEAAELGYFGAKILHPRALEPLAGSDIKIVLRDVRDPDGPGTAVRPNGSAASGPAVKSVTADRSIAVLRVHGPGVGCKPGVIGRLGRRLGDAGINIHTVITAQTCINLLLDRADGPRACEEARAAGNGVVSRLELRDDVALIAVVGDGIPATPGIAARIFGSVAGAGVNVEMISSGASDVAAYFIVREADADRAVAALHREFFGPALRPGRSSLCWLV